MWKFWLIISGLSLIAEIITTGFLVFWFAIGALIAMIISFFISNIIVQTTIFLVTSCILILSTKPLTKKFVDIKKTNTNAYSIIGKKALVIKDIDSMNSTGQIKINGEVWSAKSENGEFIPKDTEVEILKISGVKTIVRIPKEEN